ARATFSDGKRARNSTRSCVSSLRQQSEKLQPAPVSQPGHFGTESRTNGLSRAVADLRSISRIVDETPHQRCSMIDIGLRPLLPFLIIADRAIERDQFVCNSTGVSGVPAIHVAGPS